MRRYMTNPPVKQAGAVSGFYGLGIAPVFLEILSQLRFTVPTPIQERSIPPAIQGQDIIGVAETGTGKTLAFGLPMLQRLAQSKGHQGLILLPTRELALQVDMMIKKIGQSLGIRTAILIGGAPFGPQIQSIRKGPHIIIATPGRLNDFLNQKILALANIRILVLDEADRMLDMGFLPQLQRIFETLPKERQTLLFSATIPSEIMKIAANYMKLPIHIEVAPSGTAAQTVTQEIFIVEKAAKLRLLAALLKERRGSTLVFTRTKFGAKKIAKAVRDLGEKAAEIHSNRSLAQRKESLEGFRSGRYRVLVATDIASRGIDVKEIETVINYDLPSHAEDHVHRIGRTGRAGKAGHAISFATPEERNEVRNIERLIRKTIPVSSPPAPISKEPGFSTQFRPPRSVYRSGASRRQPRRHIGRRR